MEKQIKQVLNILADAGFESYLVGGYVRDKLLGIQSFDVDICTKALPKDIHNLFNSGKSNYGSVNIKSDKYNIDITTFRKDLNYVNRRPSEVVYVDSLKEDLVRRDFTINTICMDKEEKIIDLLNGVDDLNNRLIRMVGNPKERLVEDPLRILRAIRFATVLNFELEPNLKEELKKNSSLVTSLSKDRIKMEMEKILLSKNFMKGLKLLKETGIGDLIGLEYDENINFVDDLIGMWVQIKVKNIPFTNIEKSNIIKIAEVVNLGEINNETLYKYGLYVCTIAGKILNINHNDIALMYDKMPIKSRSDIDITGKEIIKIVGNGLVVSKTYNYLEKKILTGKLENNKEKIIEDLLKRK